MIKAKNKTKKQHYVPKVYLKNFCERGKIINVFDKEQLSKRKNNINDIASKNYFHDIESNPEDEDQFFEKLLGEFECQYGKTYNNLLSKLNPIIEIINNDNFNQLSFDLDFETQQTLATFFVLQNLRTDHRRKEMTQIFQHLVEVIDKTKTPDFDEHFKIKVNEDKFAPFHITMILDNLEKLSAYLIHQKWLFCINVSDRPLYTSDNPAVLDRKFCAKDGRGKGFISQGINFYLPINSKITLLIAEKSFFEANKVSLNISNNILLMNESSVIYANDLQLRNSLFQLYASKGDYFFEDMQHCLKHNINGNKDRLLIDSSIRSRKRT